MKVVRSSPLRTGHLYPQEFSSYSFLEAESTPGHMVPSVASKKSPTTPLGIDPETLRLVRSALSTTLPQALVYSSMSLNYSLNEKYFRQVVEKMKTRVSYLVFFFFSKIVSFMRQYIKIWYSRTGHRWRYIQCVVENVRLACRLTKTRHQGHSAAGGIKSMKNHKDHIGNWTSNLLSCTAHRLPC
jgi:hypothetical protein